MAYMPFSSGWRVDIAISTFFLAGVILAQDPSSQLGLTKRRQPIPSAMQKQESQQMDADRSRAEADRKVREWDRRMNRTLRSICNGC